MHVEGKKLRAVILLGRHGNRAPDPVVSLLIYCFHVLEASIASHFPFVHSRCFSFPVHNHRTFSNSCVSQPIRIAIFHLSHLYSCSFLAFSSLVGQGYLP